MTLKVLEPVILESFTTLPPVVIRLFKVLDPVTMIMGPNYYGSITESKLYPGLWR